MFIQGCLILFLSLFLSFLNEFNVTFLNQLGVRWIKYTNNWRVNKYLMAKRIALLYTLEKNF